MGRVLGATFWPLGGDKTVECQICGEEFEAITFSHLRKHETIVREYKEKYSDSPLYSEERNKKMAETLKGMPKTKEHRRKMSKAHKGRKHTDEHIKNYQKSICEGFANGRVVWNKGLTKETHKSIARISRKMKGRRPQYPQPYFSKKLGHKIRSSWEEEIGSILQMAKIIYEYESKTFKFNGTSYTPDFIIGKVLVEPHAHFFEGQEERYRQFMKAFPEYTLIMIGAGDKLTCSVHLKWEERHRLPELIKKEMGTNDR